ncbi:hypothetical protein D3C72_2176590 [compost metagenome]
MDKPQADNCSAPAFNTCDGVHFGQASSSFFQAASAALGVICCPTSERARVVNGSLWPTRCRSPNCGMSFFMMRSRFISSIFASSQ